jgi:NADPH:quinone reductase-like Zn-dependent oxidoreductase
MEALLLDAERNTASVQRIATPTPRLGEVLVRVHAVALNPVDALYVFNPLGATGRTVGSDFAGVIEDSRHKGLEPGTRVAGFLQGACSVNDRPGAFAEFLVCPGDLVWTVPDEMSLEEAATISLCALTAAQGVFYRLGLKAPYEYPSVTEGRDVTEKDGFSFFIYGASTSVGMYAAQLVRWTAKAAGRTVTLIGAASKARWPMLKAEPYAYDALVDYRDEDWPEKVKTLMGDQGVDFVYDCISEGSTVKRAASLLREGGGIAIVRSKEGGAFDAEKLRVEPIYGAVWEAFGVEVRYQNLVVPASLEARAFAVAFYKWLSEGGKLVPNPVRNMPGGLERVVPDGFALLGSGSMGDREQERMEEYMRPLSGEKMVYRIAP